MAWFSHFIRREAPPTPGSLLDRGMEAVGGTLSELRADERILVTEIDDRNERLRQTRIAIRAFEAADQILVAGNPDFAEVEPLHLRGSSPGSETILTKHTGLPS